MLGRPDAITTAAGSAGITYPAWAYLLDDALKLAVPIATIAYFGFRAWLDWRAAKKRGEEGHDPAHQ